VAKEADAGSLGRATEIRGQTLLIFGTSDPHTPEEGRAVIKRGLEEAGVDFRWRMYDAEHAFGRDVGPRYDPAATDAALAETVALLNT
jgi:carboxymethylenebutenolidase